jgi:hypothetical protein
MCLAHQQLIILTYQIMIKSSLINEILSAEKGVAQMTSPLRMAINSHPAPKNTSPAWWTNPQQSGGVARMIPILAIQKPQQTLPRKI